MVPYSELIVKAYNKMFGGGTMHKPLMLAQVALKAYAVAFILLLLMPPPLIIPFKWFNITVSAIVLGIVIALLCISRGLSNRKAWARVLSYCVFIGFTAIALPMFIRSIQGRNYGAYFWIQLWVLTMSILGLISLVFEQLTKGYKTEHAVLVGPSAPDSVR